MKNKEADTKIVHKTQVTRKNTFNCSLHFSKNIIVITDFQPSLT